MRFFTDVINEGFLRDDLVDRDSVQNVRIPSDPEDCKTDEEYLLCIESNKLIDKYYKTSTVGLEEMMQEIAEYRKTREYYQDMWEDTKNPKYAPENWPEK